MKTLTDTDTDTDIDTAATVARDDGPVRPTAVWLRRSMSAEPVMTLASKHRAGKERKAALAVRRADARHRTDG